MNTILMMQPQGQESNPWMSMLPLLLIIVVFYFFMIRPQMKRQKEIRKFRESLAKGDKVVTNGGIHGIIAGLEEKTALLQISDNTKIKIDRSAITTVLPK